MIDFCLQKNVNFRFFAAERALMDRYLGKYFSNRTFIQFLENYNLLYVCCYIFPAEGYKNVAFYFQTVGLLLG